MKSLKNLYRLPDPVDGATEVDPLSEAAGNVNTDFPVLMADKILRFEIVQCSKNLNDKSKAESIKFKCRLTDDPMNASALFIDNKPARAGFAVNQYVGITPSKEYSVDDIKRNLALWLKGILGVEASKGVSFRDFINRPDMVEKMKVDCRTGISKDKSGAFPDSTKLTPILPA